MAVSPDKHNFKKTTTHNSSFQITLWGLTNINATLKILISILIKIINVYLFKTSKITNTKNNKKIQDC